MTIPWDHVKSKAEDNEAKYTALLNYLERRLSFHEVDSVRDINMWNQYLVIEKELKGFNTSETIAYTESFSKHMKSYRKRFLIRKFQRLYAFANET